MRPIDPTRTPAGYVGGKRNLAQRIVARIETIPHRAYVPEIRALFAGFTIEPVETTYFVAGAGKAQRAGELIITRRA